MGPLSVDSVTKKVTILPNHNQRVMKEVKTVITPEKKVTL